MKSNKPTSFDIAYRAGVSQPTVSRALRNSPLVNKETRERVQAIARELNYKVDINARKLRSKESKTIALLFSEDPGSVDTAISPFFLSILASITRASARRGYDLLISFQHYSENWGADYEDTHKADGIIFLGYGDYLTYIKKIAQLEEVGAHFIAWGPVLPNQPGHFVGCDNVDGGYQLTKHLISLGHKRIAFIGSTGEFSPEFGARYQGHTKALLESNIVVDPNLQSDAHVNECDGFEGMETLIEKNIEFSAVFCATDVIAMNAIRALAKHGIRVPEEVAVVGFDDIPMSSFCSPPLTTVKQDTQVAGDMLVDKLIELIDGKEIQSTQLPTHLVIRESCGNNIKLG